MYIWTASDTFGFCLVTGEVVFGVWTAVTTLPVSRPNCTLWSTWKFFLHSVDVFSEPPRKSLMKDYFMIREWKSCWCPTITFSEHLWNFSHASGKIWVIFLEMQNETVVKSNCEARTHRFAWQSLGFSSIWLLAFNFLFLISEMEIVIKISILILN